jgi:hypothetical protein
LGYFPNIRRLVPEIFASDVVLGLKNNDIFEMARPVHR